MRRQHAVGLHHPLIRFVSTWGTALTLAACGGGDTNSSEQTDQGGSAKATASSAYIEGGSTTQGPVDRGNGPPPVVGTRLSLVSAAKNGRAFAAAVAVAAGPEVAGRFTQAVGWPVIPIHMALLPDGRVMSYGTDEQGLQSGQFNYAVWDPKLGIGPDAHLLLPNTTGTDIFCNAQIVVPRTGEVILTGGDSSINGVRNYSNADINFFDYLTSSMRKRAQPMAQRRWYPSVVTLTNGSVLVLGGRDQPIETSAIATPELYDPDTSNWRSLTGASSDAAYGKGDFNWYYPRAWTAPDGQVFVASPTGLTFMMDPAGNGSITQQALVLPVGDHWLPAVMFAPGRILSVRQAALVSVIDLNGSTPSASATSPLSQERLWSNATVMADGKVLVSGGSALENQAIGVAYQAEIWDPSTGNWAVGASATRMRLYHSTAMLLPDGRVLTAGGGAPGPVSNLNAEIYEPPYLFKHDGSGDYALRPVIQNAPQQVAWGNAFSMQVQSNTPVSKVAWVKTGSVTHSFDFDQRYLTATFTQSGNTLTVQAPASANQAPPGNYLLFAFDAAGVPSIAKIVRLIEAGAAYPNAITVRARADLAAGIGAMMDVRVDGNLIASVEVRNTTDQDFTFALPSVTPGGAAVEVVYTNDETVSGEKRNLHVTSVSINRNTLLPTDASAVFDRGSGSAAYDNIDTVGGTALLNTNGAMRWPAPGGPISTLIVRARAEVAEGVGALMQIRVNGVLAASQEIVNPAFSDYVIRVPQALTPGTKLDVVFVNDGSATGDRNLYIESVKVNGSTLLPTDPGATVDIGSGTAAFDGSFVIPGQGALYWNAALRLTVPALAPQIKVRAKATLAAGVGPIMQVLVDGALVGSIEVTATNYTDFIFPLSTPVSPGARVDLVFNNDGGNATEDRNLYIASLTVNGAWLQPSDPGVIVDIGSGAGAFDGVNTIAGQGDILWNAALRFIAPSATLPSLTVRAKGSLAGGVGPIMQVLIDGIQVGSVPVQSTSFTDFLIPLQAAVNPGAHVDIVFNNDGVIGADDRNLYVQSLTVNGSTLLPSDPGVLVDIGSGSQAFDGNNVIPGQSDILWNAALRFSAPNPTAPTMTVTAKASLAAGVGPLMQVLVNGIQVGAVEVRSTSYGNYVFTLPALIKTGDRVDIVFANDGGTSTEDRNLYVQSLTVNTSTLRPSDPGVSVDIGSGAAAFDGVMVIAGQTDILWNASLRFIAP
jgi:hypothetical protein